MAQLDAPLWCIVPAIVSKQRSRAIGRGHYNADRVQYGRG